MATTYLSPGVYVEEIPSAQKAIAGVGTNTVGFIGMFEKDTIQIPKPNEKYDAALSKKVDDDKKKKPKEIREKIKAAENEFKEKKTVLKEAEAKLETAEEDFRKATAVASKPNATQAQKDKAQSKETAKTTAENSVNEAKLPKEEAETKLADLRKPLEVDENLIIPYKLEPFKVEVKQGVTKLCTNFGEYTIRFGGFSADREDEKGTAMDPGHRALTHAVYGFFQNGGTRCFVAWVKDEGDIGKALKYFESIDAVAIIAAPGCTSDTTYEALRIHCDLCKDRFAILDYRDDLKPEDDLDIDNRLNYGDPSTKSILPKPDKNMAYYFPWIEVMDPAKRLQDRDLRREVAPKHRGKVYVPPSGHMAGIYARIDEERGVHKAPANTPVMGALNVKYYIGRPKHGLLNPQGVNVIRNINGNILVWGARTIGGDKNSEWKYVSVRRLFLYLKESIDEGTQWVVFEPNDPALWLKIRRNVSDFLTNVWRSGALFGSTPEQAFYVKCDEETNPPEVRELGQVVTEIGVAIVRPAEFVIFRVTQAGSIESM